MAEPKAYNGDMKRVTPGDVIIVHNSAVAQRLLGLLALMQEHQQTPTDATGPRTPSVVQADQRADQSLKPKG
jgi:hypothetical protein